MGAVEQTLKVLVQAGTGFHRSQMLLTEGNGTQTIRSRRGSDMAELCTACPCTPRAPSNIEAFPSAIVKSLKITALGGKGSPTTTTTTPSAQRADGRPRLRSELFRTPPLARLLWTESTLETSCRHVVQAAPFSFQPSRSALPPVIRALNAPWSTCWQLQRSWPNTYCI